MAYNAFWLMAPSTENIKKTIEFRQHQGSLDSEAIMHWAKTCVGLVEFARTIAPEELRTFLLRHVDDDYGAPDLFDHIGLGDQATYYRQRH